VSFGAAKIYLKVINRCSFTPTKHGRVGNKQLRNLISFVCAIGLGLGCFFGLYFLVFERRSYLFAAAVGLGVAAYWLWEDFIRRV
jgi:hypothetical protein